MKWYPPAESKIPLTVLRQYLRSDARTAEPELRGMTGSGHCLFGPSGRSLLYLLLVMLAGREDKRRNEVLVPGYTCYSVPAAVVKAGLKLRFYDLEPESFNPLSASVKENCNPNTLAIISQHLLGIPADVRAISQIAAIVGAYHIEDAAQAYGGRLNGHMLGTSGDFGFFSFGRGKSLPLGGGGALVSNKHYLKEIEQELQIDAGWPKLAITLLSQPASQPGVYWIAEKLPLGLGQTIFNPRFKVGNIPRSILKLFKPMMACFPEMNRHRNAISSIYQNTINPVHLIAVNAAAKPVHPRYPVLGKAGPLPFELVRMGVRRLYPNALPMETAIAAFATGYPQKLPGAQTLAQRLITLPTHRGIDAGTAKAIANQTNHWILNGQFSISI